MSKEEPRIKRLQALFKDDMDLLTFNLEVLNRLDRLEQENQEIKDGFTAISKSFNAIICRVKKLEQEGGG